MNISCTLVKFSLQYLINFTLVKWFYSTILEFCTFNGNNSFFLYKYFKEQKKWVFLWYYKDLYFYRQHCEHGRWFCIWSAIWGISVYRYHYLIFLLASQKSPYPFYVSVYGQINNVTRIIQRLLTHYIGTVEKNHTESCTSSEKASLQVTHSISSQLYILQFEII